MELTTEAARSRHLPGFLQGFSQRVARMLDADWCGVAVLAGQDAGLHSTRPTRECGLDERTILNEASNAIRGKQIAWVRDAHREGANRSGLAVIPVCASDGEPL